MSESPPRRTIFIDCNSGGRLFAGLIRNEGINVVLHNEHFGALAKGEKAPEDRHWLLEIGRLGWLGVTGDKRTIREPAFLQILPKSQALLFILADLNGKTPEEKARCIVDAYPTMIGLAAAAQRPAVWIFTNGRAKEFDWKTRLQQYYRWGRIQKH